MLVGLAIAGTFAAAPWGHDDGWIVLIARQWREIGEFRYLLLLDNAPYTLSKPWFWLSAQLLADGPWMIYAQRLPTLGLNIATWLLLRRGLGLLGLDGFKPLLAAAVVYSVVVIVLLGTIRQEPAAVCAVAFAFYAAAAWLEGNRFVPLAAGFPVAGLALTIHPLGLAAGACIAIVGMAAWATLAPSRRLMLVAVAVASAALTVRLALWDLTPVEFLAAFRQAATLRAYGFGPADEWQRYLRLIAVAPVAALVIYTGIIALLVWIATAWRRDRRTRIAAAAAAAIFIVLLVNPAKWDSYAAVWTPLAVLGAALAGRRARMPDAVAGLAALALLAPVWWQGFGHAANPAQSSTWRLAFGQSPTGDIEQARRLVAGRTVLMDSALYPRLDGFARLLPFDKTQQVPDVVIVEKFNLYMLDLTDHRDRYRLAHRFDYEGRVFDLYVRGDGAAS